MIIYILSHAHTFASHIYNIYENGRTQWRTGHALKCSENNIIREDASRVHNMYIIY